MRFGFLIPIENSVFVFVVVLSIGITLLWLVFQAISYANKKDMEYSFNRTFVKDELSILSYPLELSQLLENISNRKVNIDSGTLVFWTNDGLLAIAIARGSPQSLFKVFLRLKLPASELGHRITVVSPASHSVTFRVTAESLIFSSNDSTLYDVDYGSLNTLSEMLKEMPCSINNTIPIPPDNAMKVIEWISHVVHVHKQPQQKLLIGE